jgi:hypothetical protein
MEKKWPKAREALGRALPALLEIGYIHPITTATLLKLACVDLEEGEIKAAM